IEKAFLKDKLLFSLAIYYPLGYYKGPREDIDPLEENRQKQVVALIRTQFLKRLESSAHAFERSCQRLLLKFLTFMTKHCETESEKHVLERWKYQHDELIEYIHNQQLELFGGEDEGEAEEDLISDEMLEDVEYLSRDEYKVEEILQETILDLDQIAEFLDELKKFKPQHDDKLKALIRLLTKDQVLSQHKVIIFTEYSDTATYLFKQLQENSIEGLDKVDSTDKRDRGDILRRFAPYYNDSSSAGLQENREKEIRVLISTDVLSERAQPS
ncbi:unnamed protein product, partial [marine sediment metagenome]